MHRLRALLSALKPTPLAVLFAVLVGLGVGFWQWGRPPQPRVVLENLGAFPHGCFSPDGRTLATVHMPEEDEFAVSLWDAESGRKKHDLFTGEWPRQVLFSPDGRKLACRFAAEIWVWDVASGNKLITYDQRYWPIVFSGDGKLLFLRSFTLHDVRNNKMVKTLMQYGDRLIAFGDNALLVRGHGEGIKVWDLQAARVVAERKDLPIPWGNKLIGPWHQAHLSLDRRFLIYEYEGTVSAALIFDLVTGEKHELKSATDSITFATMAPDGQSVVMEEWQPVAPTLPSSWWSSFTNWLGIQSQPSQHTVILKTFPADTEIMSLQHGRSPVFSPDGRTLLVSAGHNGGTLQLWDLPIRKPIGKILGLAALAAVATLLAINGFGWLRRRSATCRAAAEPQ
ncbi:MAG TPA: hypothetical protein VKE98_11190 [Gemmataceae bacterium]|nr:hypothetical protein [Gemmataceae bacterium]